MMCWQQRLPKYSMKATPAGRTLSSGRHLFHPVAAHPHASRAAQVVVAGRDPQGGSGRAPCPLRDLVGGRSRPSPTKGAGPSLVRDLGSPCRDQHSWMSWRPCRRCRAGQASSTGAPARTEPLHSRGTPQCSRTPRRHGGIRQTEPCDRPRQPLGVETACWCLRAFPAASFTRRPTLGHVRAISGGQCRKEWPGTWASSQIGAVAQKSGRIGECLQALLVVRVVPYGVTVRASAIMIP